MSQTIITKIGFILIVVFIMIFLVGDLYLSFFPRKKIKWDNITINENIERPDFEEDDWSYPWYMVKHDGGFENTLGEPITAKDTTKLYHNALCYTHIGEDKESRLKFAKATQKGDTTYIKLYDESASNNEYLELELWNGSFNSKYHIDYMFEYDSISFKVKQQSLILNKDTYQEGETLIGKVNIDVVEIIHFGKNKRNAVNRKNIRGIFEVEITL